MLKIDPEDAAVKHPVMKRAQRDAVVGFVWSVEVEPTDVCSLDADRHAIQLPVEAAKGTLPVPRFQD